MKNKEFLSTAELAKILGISRVAVFKKIKKGKIKAMKVGRSFIIRKKNLTGILPMGISDEGKREIDAAVKKTVKEYGQTLKMLGDT
ncbi:excisionase family DNA-binding protein [Patescibacteria group bacterium]|nr:excisionase family DNA-binding protein [Patescibacteria group bacterium]MBU4367654.1 excisionase family DNA-binding protein [Patescibacteria group bacterium]MBU4461896.1 excisionase family DNA-binding protein [Patescibacteria group bacterium]MCG2699973.1 excisionase family DNA-binding protein [Candidatus Parcubacteria bacterium]